MEYHNISPNSSKLTKFIGEAKKPYMEQAVVQLKRRLDWPYSVIGGFSLEVADLKE